MIMDRHSNVHILKILPEFLAPLLTKEKNFEVRYNDRKYRAGDLLVLREWHPHSGLYTGRWMCAQISYILNDPRYCKEGYVVLGLKFIES